MRGYCVTLKMRPDKWRSFIAVEGADRLHMFMLMFMLLISFPSYFIYLQYIVCPLSANYSCMFQPVQNFSPFVSSIFPSCLLTEGSVQCSHVIRLLILSRQRGSMSPPPQHSITNSPSQGFTQSHQLPHAPSSVQTIISRLRHRQFLLCSIFKILSVRQI